MMQGAASRARARERQQTREAAKWFANVQAQGQDELHATHAAAHRRISTRRNWSEQKRGLNSAVKSTKLSRLTMAFQKAGKEAIVIGRVMRTIKKASGARSLVGLAEVAEVASISMRATAGIQTDEDLREREAPEDPLVGSLRSIFRYMILLFLVMIATSGARQPDMYEHNAMLMQLLSLSLSPEDSLPSEVNEAFYEISELGDLNAYLAQPLRTASVALAHSAKVLPLHAVTRFRVRQQRVQSSGCSRSPLFHGLAPERCYGSVSAILENNNRPPLLDPPPTAYLCVRARVCVLRARAVSSSCSLRALANILHHTNTQLATSAHSTEAFGPLDRWKYFDPTSGTPVWWPRQK